MSVSGVLMSFLWFDTKPKYNIYVQYRNIITEIISNLVNRINYCILRRTYILSIKSKDKNKGNFYFHGMFLTNHHQILHSPLIIHEQVIVRYSTRIIIKPSTIETTVWLSKLIRRNDRKHPNLLGNCFPIHEIKF